MAKIHPTAIVHPDATIGDDVEIGPHSIVESDVTIGPGSVLREGVVIRRYTTIGKGNLVDAHAVLGGIPQDIKWDPEMVSYLQIGDDNVFREGVTLSRGSKPGGSTVIGSRTYFMAFSHVGHDATVGDEAILCNGALVGGHATVGERVFLSSNVGIHQFTWVGEGVMSRGNSGTSAHVPPFCLFMNINNVVGLNVVGMRRNSEMTADDRAQIKEAFRLTYRCGLTPTAAVEEMDRHTDWGSAAGKFRDFVRKVVDAEPPFKRALCPMRRLRAAD